jgi:hypothetical protein
MPDLIFPSSGALPLGNYLYPGAGGSADYGLLHDFYQIGGYQVLPTIAERNSIPVIRPEPFTTYTANFIDPTGFASGRRKIGMIVYVQETGETYRLIPKGYFGNGGTGATGDSTSWLALPPWEKVILLNPTVTGIFNDTLLGLDQNFNAIYEGVTGSGNPDDCWVRVSTETEVTYVEPAEISSNVYGGTASKGILEYSSSITYLVKFPTTNTGPVTLSIDGFEALDVKKVNANGVQPLVNGEIDPDIVYPVFYDGTQFQIQVFETAPIGVQGPDGSVLTTGLTGFYFKGTGVSASATGGFVTIDFTGGSGGGSPIGVYGTAGDVLTSGATGIQFIGTGVSSSATGDYVTVQIDQYTYPGPLTVSLSPGKSFGRYVDGETIPATGKTPGEVIVMALSEVINPIVNLNPSTTSLPFFTENVSVALNLSYTIKTIGATAASVALEWRRNNTGAWTSLFTGIDNPYTYNHSFTNSPRSSTEIINYRYTVTDSQGGTNQALGNVSFVPYSAPSISFSLNRVNGTNPPESDTVREKGNVVTNIVSGLITRNSPLVNLQSYDIQYQVNGAGSWITVPGGSDTVSGSSYSIPTLQHDESAGLSGSNSISYRIQVDDDYQTTTSSTQTVTFQYLVFCGPVSAIPSTSSDIRALSSRYRSSGVSQIFDLATGMTERRFSVALPESQTMIEANDPDAFFAPLLNKFNQNVQTNFVVNDYAGNPKEYTVYTLVNDVAYSDKSHVFKITRSN